MLTIGDNAPAFELLDHAGNVFELETRSRERVLVIYFYPKDETPGCTVQACGFRDAYTDFVEAGAEVIGISHDDVASHADFRRHHDLPFTLLSDPRGEVRRAFAVPKSLGLMPGRTTFVIDTAGVIQHVFNSQMRVKKHVANALDIVRRLRREGP